MSPNPLDLSPISIEVVKSSLQPQLGATKTTKEKRKRGGDQCAANSYPNLLRKQQLQACEIAFAALDNREEQALRWFTRDVLRIASELTPMVCLALWQKNKAGEYHWRTAQYPLAYLRTLALRTAAKWKRDPIMEGSLRGKAASATAAGVGLSRNPYTSRFDPSRLKGGYDFEDEDWHDAAIEYFGHRSDVASGGCSPRGAEQSFSDLQKAVDERFILREGNEPRDWLPRNRRGPEYDWTVIGKELGFDDDETELLKAKANWDNEEADDFSPSLDRE